MIWGTVDVISVEEQCMLFVKMDRGGCFCLEIGIVRFVYARAEDYSTNNHGNSN